MNKSLLLIAVLLYTAACLGQDITVRVRDAGSKTSLPNATVSIASIKKNFLTDTLGFINVREHVCVAVIGLSHYNTAWLNPFA